MPHKIWHWLNDLAARYNIFRAKMETQDSILMLLFGVWLFFVDRSADCPHSYKVLLSVARQEIWGIVFVSIGLTSLVTIEHGTMWLRKWILLVQSGLWVFIFCAAYISDWRAPSVPIYFILGISGFYSFLCLKGDKTR
jgi:hypothetical protein